VTSIIADGGTNVTVSLLLWLGYDCSRSIAARVASPP
jgi:hypothetical protein